VSWAHHTSGPEPHVWPEDDVIEHETGSEGCVCVPRVEPVKTDSGGVGWIHVHHSLDGRERNEA
jgi:hypothetical protein